MQRHSFIFPTQTQARGQGAGTTSAAGQSTRFSVHCSSQVHAGISPSLRGAAWQVLRKCSTLPGVPRTAACLWLLTYSTSALPCAVLTSPVPGAIEMLFNGLDGNRFCIVSKAVACRQASHMSIGLSSGCTTYNQVPYQCTWEEVEDSWAPSPTWEIQRPLIPGYSLAQLCPLWWSFGESTSG